MHNPIITTLETLAAWRSDLDRGAAGLARFMADHELADTTEAALLGALRERLAADKLVLAFVAEFSRGKSELINAIFFADAGRRVLPATPGRTTMCPVELFFDAAQPPRLMLLPIETRLKGLALSELREREDVWHTVALDPGQPHALADSLAAVTKTRRVSVAEATALGFWSETHPEENPPLESDGGVDVPAWRHALINYPHPLLERGLVVIDTPGLNAIGAEPELTLSLLPSAHATVFVLAADTGVTRSDLAIWREHLAGNALERFVVLNKIDTLVDPFASAHEVAAQIERQCESTAATLGVSRERVFPLSAREALAARVGGDVASLQASRLPALEAALTAELLPRQHELLVASAAAAVNQLRAAGARRIADRRRQHAEQLLELRGLRGKSGAKLDMMLKRVEAEAAEFEACTTKLQAMRAVHSRMLKDALVGLSSDRLREEVGTMQEAMAASLLNLGAKKAFVGLCQRLRGLLDQATRHSREIKEMLGASFTKLNAEFGFSLALNPGPDMDRFAGELNLIEKSYVQYLGLTQALRLSQPKFMEQFRRMLMSKLRVVFENASAELELWNKSASAQVDAQLRERRRAFRRRREALERIQAAASELETRLSELAEQDSRLNGFMARCLDLAESMRREARGGPRGELGSLIELDLPLSDEPEPTLLARAHA